VYRPRNLGRDLGHDAQASVKSHPAASATSSRMEGCVNNKWVPEDDRIATINTPTWALTVAERRFVWLRKKHPKMERHKLRLWAFPRNECNYRRTHGEPSFGGKCIPPREPVSSQQRDRSRKSRILYAVLSVPSLSASLSFSSSRTLRANSMGRKGFSR
jgi:hypothetical protein